MQVEAANVPRTLVSDSSKLKRPVLLVYSTCYCSTFLRHFENQCLCTDEKASFSFLALLTDLVSLP